MRLPRPGLRAQIVLSLSSVFALSFWLAGYATLQLTRRSALLDEARAAQIVARTLATALEQPGDRTDPALSSLCLGLGSRMQLVALRVERPGGSVFSCGRALGVVLLMVIATSRKSVVPGRFQALAEMFRAEEKMRMLRELFHGPHISARALLCQQPQSS